MFFHEGIPVHVNKHLGREFVQVKFPRSKTRRIRKKWMKNKRKYWAYRSTKDECFQMEVPTVPSFSARSALVGMGLVEDRKPPTKTILVVSPSFFNKLKEMA